ncbi:hypothetical protein [Streptomyces sp. bgisy032]|uniref:hypothetical protein n=1 Tax=Streptomyces sp. bgisy032 TaxID=3413773 RepID=UPI003D75C891
MAEEGEECAGQVLVVGGGHLGIDVEQCQPLVGDGCVDQLGTAPRTGLVEEVLVPSLPARGRILKKVYEAFTAAQ